MEVELQQRGRQQLEGTKLPEREATLEADASGARLLVRALDRNVGQVGRVASVAQDDILAVKCFMRTITLI